MLNYLLKWKKYNIKRNELVLEIGSGNNPFIRSDILCDKFPFSSYERSTCSQIVIDRPFVIADAIHLPFKDKSINFIYCSDLAEYLEHPHIFFVECMRVSHKGVIITPSMLAEQLFGWDFHAVMYTYENEKLIIHRKTHNNWGWFNQIFHNLNTKDINFNKFVKKRPDLFRLEYQWQNKILYEYDPTQINETEIWSRKTSDENIVNEAIGTVEAIKRKIKSLLSLIVRKIF